MENLFSCENVIAAYSRIQTGRSKQEKDEANQFIVSFMASEQAWSVALELLTSPSQNAQGNSHFIGAQALYQKLDRSFETELESRESHIIELRDQILKLLLSSHQQQMNYHKMVIERLCMCVSYLILYTSNTCWKTSCADIISFGSSHGPHECFVALCILKNVCVTFGHKTFNARQTSLVKRWVIESAGPVMAYIC